MMEVKVAWVDSENTTEFLADIQQVFKSQEMAIPTWLTVDLPQSTSFLVYDFLPLMERFKKEYYSHDFFLKDGIENMLTLAWKLYGDGDEIITREFLEGYEYSESDITEILGMITEGNMAWNGDSVILDKLDLKITWV